MLVAEKVLLLSVISLTGCFCGIYLEYDNPSACRIYTELNHIFLKPKLVHGPNVTGSFA